MPIQLTKAVKAILILSFVSFLIQQTADQFFGWHLLSLFALVPHSCVFEGHIWQILTYSFVHRDVMHLFFSLIMIAFIGAELESTWGTVRFLQYYFFCSISAGVFYLLLQVLVRGGLYVPMIGSAGAIYGLLMAYGLIFGERVMLFMMLFPMKAKHFVWVLALLELMTTIYSSGGGVASFAQLGGMAAGFLFLWIRATLILKKKSLGSRPGRFNRFGRRKAKHLKLVINNEKEFDQTDDSSDKGPKTWH